MAFCRAGFTQDALVLAFTQIEDDMQGTILSYSKTAHEGIISGEDNNRYTFGRFDWKSDKPPVSGRKVDFVGENGTASQIFAIGEPALMGEKNKIVAALLAFFLGSFGFHKFYLGYNKSGMIMLIVFLLGFILVGLPSIVIGVIAFIEAIIYITKSDVDFEEIYVNGKREWF